MRRTSAWVACTLVLLGACTSGSGGHQIVPSGVLTPAFPTETTTCADYALSVTTTEGTQPLASCSGTVQPPKDAIQLHVGDSIEMTSSMVTGDHLATWTASPSSAVKEGAHRRGSDGGTSTAFTTLAPGKVIVTAHHVACELGTGPQSCDVLILDVR